MGKKKNDLAVLMNDNLHIRSLKGTSSYLPYGYLSAGRNGCLADIISDGDLSFRLALLIVPRKKTIVGNK